MRIHAVRFTFLPNDDSEAQPSARLVLVRKRSEVTDIVGAFAGSTRLTTRRPYGQVLVGEPGDFVAFVDRAGKQLAELRLVEDDLAPDWGPVVSRLYAKYKNLSK
jgi:hypothetical protein